MKALNHLKLLTDFNMSFDDMNEISREKVKDTLKYSISKNEKQNKSNAAKRIAIATLAEQMVAQHMNGNIANFEIDYNDPFTYAYDVVAGHEYHNIRIEVKTHQKDNDWINVNLELENVKGYLNVHHFLKYDVADYIIIFRSEKNDDGSYHFKTEFIGNKDDLTSVITRSCYNREYYLNINK